MMFISILLFKRYEPVQNFLTNKPRKVELIVLCFGSLGCIKNNIYGDLRKLSLGKSDIMQTLRWCSISNLKMAN